MLIAMLSLLGIPLFAGFIGKLLLLKSLAMHGLLGVLLIIVFASLLESTYYFKLAGFMFSKEKRAKPLTVGCTQKLLFTFLALLLVFIGVAPFFISSFLSDSATTMLNANAYITNLVGAK
jgi:NADH:ubiquinone oxidoreductase subunit 2 (subunit N)